MSILLIILFAVIIIKIFKTNQYMNDTIFKLWKAAFIINILSKAAEFINNKLLNRAKIQHLIQTPDGLKRLHRRILILKPSNYKELATHLIKLLFK